MPNYKANVTLTVYDGQEAFRTRTLTLYSGLKALIGRSATEIGHTTRPPPARGNAFFDSPVVSRQHAHLILGTDRAVSIVDVGSLHGTFVNSHKIKAWEQKRLQDGDDIEIGGKVAAGERIFSARRFKINYYLEPYYLHVEPPEPSHVPAKPVESAEVSGAVTSGTTIPSPCQSTTFVVPDSSSDDSHDSSSCLDSLELDEDDMQIIDELSSSPVSKPQPNNASQTNSVSNKTNHDQVLLREHKATMQPTKLINLAEEEESDAGDSELRPAAIDDSPCVLDLDGQVEDDSDLDDDDYHPIDDSSNEESEGEYDPESVPVRHNLPASVTGNPAASAVDPEWTVWDEASLAEEEADDDFDDLYDPPETSLHRSCIDMSQHDSNFNPARAAFDQPEIARGTTDFFMDSSRQSPAAFVPIEPPEYHSYYPISGISRDPYSPSVAPRYHPNYRFERDHHPVPTFTSGPLGPTFIFGSSTGQGSKTITNDADTTAQQIGDPSPASQVNPKDSLPGLNAPEKNEHRPNPRKRKADQISTDDPLPGITATCHQVSNIEKSTSQPLPLTSNPTLNVEKKTSTFEKLDSSVTTPKTSSVKQTDTPTSSSSIHPKVTSEPTDEGAATLENKDTVPAESKDDERPAKRCRVQESHTPTQRRPRTKPKTKSSLTTFALGAVLGGVVGGISVMGALISLPDSLF